MFITSPFVRYQNCEHDTLKPNGPIFMQIGTNGLQGKGMK